MRKITPLISIFLLLFCGCKNDPAKHLAPNGSFELSIPQVEVDSIFFNQSASVKFHLNHPETEIYYDFGDNEVTRNSNKYVGPVIIDTSTKISARAFHKEFLPSESISSDLIQVKDYSDKVKVLLNEPAHQNYPGNGNQNLLDLKKGSTNFRLNNYWMGFQRPQVLIDLQFENEETIQSITLSNLKDHNSWIFSPKTIRLMSGNEILAEQQIDRPESHQPTKMSLTKVHLQTARKLKNLTVQIINEEIPEWHAGKGTMPWLFIDEILIN